MAHINKTTPVPVSARIYALERIPMEEYHKIFGVLLASDHWHTLMDRRNKFAKVISRLRTGSPEANSAFREIVKIDEKAAGFILTTLVDSCLKLDNVEAKRMVTLAQFKDDFVNTHEKEEAYETFNRRLDQANFLVDTVESIITDAKEQLHKIDPTAVLTEFDSIKRVQAILTDYSLARHKDEHPELFDCFAKYSDEITDFVTLKSAQFNEECRAIRRDLTARDELVEGSNKKKHQRPTPTLP